MSLLVKQLFSHAFAPVFQYTPDHPAHECRWCQDVKRHRHQHVHELIPLEYQNNILTSTMLTRFSMFVSTEKEYAAELQMTKKFSQVNRLLTNTAILPTSHNIIEESKNLISHMKINDSLFVFLGVKVKAESKDIGWVIDSLNDDGDTVGCRDLLSVWETSDLPLTVCVVTTGTENIFQLQYGYALTSVARDAIVAILSEMPASLPVKKNIGVLHLSVQNIPELCRVLAQHRYRISLFRLLQLLPESVMFSNRRVSPKITQFSFCTL